MAEFAESVNKFLSFNEYKILGDKGKISHVQAENKALAEYTDFNKTQFIESDFDREIKKMLRARNKNLKKEEWPARGGTIMKSFPKPIKIQIIYDKKLRELTGVNSEEAMISEIFKLSCFPQNSQNLAL